MRIKFTIPVITLLLFATPSYAGFFLVPKAGLTFDMDGNSAASLGVRAGYEFDLEAFRIGAGLGYTYLDRETDNDLVDLSGYVGIPVLPVLDLYVMGGTFLKPAGANYNGGIGLVFGVPFIEMIRLGINAIYYHFEDITDFVETSAYIALSF